MLCLLCCAMLLAADAPVIDKPLIAYWTFDEESGVVCRDSAGNACDAAPEKSDAPGLERTRGLFGNAMRFSGHHALRTEGKPALGGMSAISFSAWVRPTGFEQYCEIFRKEDGEQRVLFAFQENATILSLGLNINGYIECDAPIKRAQVLDGQWHHCAATFDGAFMRVYLDGVEIGSLERRGTIRAGGAAPGCIGSANGGECFQGTMDDLRIYDEALAVDDIARLYKSGLEAAAVLAKEQEAALDTFYAARESFAETLADSRKNIVEKAIPINRDLANAAVAKLNARFTEEYRNFVAWTGMNPADYLLAKDAPINEKIVERLIELMLEYKPLTEHQRANQTPEQLKQWQEAEEIQRRFDVLKQQGDAAQFSPEWIRLVFDAAPRIQFRPSVQEPVAPYVTPTTPETRDLTPDEARQALERDWLHQANDNPTPEHIRDEIKWTRQLAARIEREHPNLDLKSDLSDLSDMSDRSDRSVRSDRSDRSDAANKKLYFRVREIKRRIMFKNPVIDFDKMLLVDMPFPAGSEWPHETRHRLGYMAVPGGRLLVLDGLSPEGKLTQLMPQAPFHGSFWRPDLSFDGTKVLVCFKPHNEKSFHLYEINTDGTGLVQLTDGPYDDFDPIYLPDEHIMFDTTRGHAYVRCMPPTNAYMLARCDGDGRNIYLISQSNEPEYLPSVMNDGRVVYTRWEYTDKPLWRAQSLWTLHPDGTQSNTYWGNQSVWPDLLKDARSIPGSRRVMFTGSAHHNWFSGSVGIIDADKGINFPDGLTKVTADLEWPESGNGPVDPVESPNYHRSGKYEAYYSPYPLSEKDFIVSANRDGKFVLYLMDVDGNRELIYEGVYNIFHALPLKPRVKPPVLQDIVAWPTPEERLNPKGGVIYSNNVYQGAPEELRGKAKFLRVLSIDAKTYTYWHKRPYISTGPVVSGVQSEGVKRVLGTVPIEPDGSVAFQAPTGIALHFQLLDENHRALQTMRSFTGVMPGESRGCLGCHARHSAAPMAAARFAETSKEPHAITPPPFADNTVSYARYVRPVLDKHCAKCHEGDGKAKAKLDLTPRPGMLDFDETYWLFTGKPAWGAPYEMPKDPPPGFGIAGMIMVEGFDQRDPAAYQTPKPMTKLSYTSKLIDIASSGKHHNVKVDPESLERLILWVDTMCPYLGEEEVRAIPDPEFQGVDWLAIRPLIANAPNIIRPGPVDKE